MTENSLPPSALTPEEHAELVAYLDGELSEEAARAIELRISQETRWSAEAESLQKAWDLLDFLPQTPEPTPHFTQITLSRLRSRQGPTSVGAKLGWLLLGSGAWGVTLLFAGLCAYNTYRWTYPPEPGEKELLRDLRLIENKRYYDRIDNFDFLEKLDDPDLFGDITSP